MAQDNNKSSNQGFIPTDEEKKGEMAPKSGQGQGKESNPSNSASDREKAAEAGKKDNPVRSSGMLDDD